MRLIKQIRRPLSSLLPKETSSRKSQLAKDDETTHQLTEQQRKEEVEKLMRIYLKPPTYEQSLQAYEQYLSQLSKSDSFKAQFLFKELKEMRDELGKQERSASNKQLIAGSFFGMVFLLVVYKFFYEKITGRLGKAKGQYLKDRIRLWIYAIGLSPARKDWNECFFDLIAQAPECFWKMSGMRYFVVERFNQLLRQNWVEKAILEYDQRAQLVTSLIRASMKINDKTDVLLLSILTRLFALLKKDQACLTKESIEVMTKVLLELPNENPNSVFVRLAILQIIRLHPDASEVYKVPPPMVVESENDLFKDYYLASSSFKQFVVERMKQADETVRSIAKAKVINTSSKNHG